ncbi:hypothetical protein F511_46047 [Dorcoceras hygrometricum]|uniref:Uncharacterized protein n=1 Tax=Dorcoceras hygrometricum TaxID=472368 RepID=A0A2Z6ZUZ8_9LAMI|nr:hypothetical protein F511_46047 [Dorcoceras hygrometricum]
MCGGPFPRASARATCAMDAHGGRLVAASFSQGVRRSAATWQGLDAQAVAHWPAVCRGCAAGSRAALRMNVRRSWPTDAAGFLRNCCANSSDHAQESCAVIGHA